MPERVVSSEEQLIRTNDKNVITNRRISLNYIIWINILLKNSVTLPLNQGI